MAVDYASLVSVFGSPTTITILLVFIWKVYPKLLNIEKAALRANHNSSVMAKAMLRRKEFTPEEERELDLT